jgi:zinc and cadmium transporter
VDRDERCGDERHRAHRQRDLLLRPEQLQRLRPAVFLWLLAGFTVFFAVEQFLHWHHSHRVIVGVERQPLTYLVLIGDGLHNLLGGLAVAAAFIADVRVGIGAWLAAAAHEIPRSLATSGCGYTAGGIGSERCCTT